MESRGLGKFIVTLEHWNGRHGSAKNSEVVRFQADNKDTKTEATDREVNSHEQDICPQINDVTDDQNPASVPNQSFEGEKKHRRDNNVIAFSAPPLQFQTNEDPGSGPTPNHHGRKDVRKAIYNSSATKLQTLESRGPFAGLFQRLRAQLLDRDQSLSCKLDTIVGLFHQLAAATCLIIPCECDYQLRDEPQPIKDLQGKANAFVSLLSLAQQVTVQVGTHGSFKRFDEACVDYRVRSGMSLDNNLQALELHPPANAGEEQETQKRLSQLLKRLLEELVLASRDLAAKIDVPNIHDVEKENANNDRKSDRGQIALRTDTTKMDTRTQHHYHTHTLSRELPRQLQTTRSRASHSLPSFPLTFQHLDKLHRCWCCQINDLSLWLLSHCVGRDMSIITFPPMPFTDSNHRSPASCSMSVRKRKCYVRSRDFEEDDYEAGSDWAKHTMTTTTPATMAMVAMIWAASKLMDTKLTEHTEHMHEKMYFSLLNTEREKEDFRRHMRKYIKMWLPDCPFEISTTNRYTILTQEAATARRPQAPNVPKRRVTGILQATADSTSHGLRGCHANHELAPSDTVISAMLNGDHTGQDGNYRMIYSRSLDTHNLDPIPGSSSSGLSCFHGENCSAHLIQPLYLIMRYYAEQIMMLGITVEHDPCTKDSTLNRREATNTIDTTRNPLNTGPEPSGSELLEMKYLGAQHVRAVKHIVIDPTGQEALRTAINSGSTYGHRDFGIRSLDHSIHTKRFEAHQEHFEHQIQVFYHATPMIPPSPPLTSSPISSTVLTPADSKDCLPISCSMQMMASTQRPTNIEKRIDRQVHHKGDALSKDIKIAPGHGNNNLVGARKQRTPFLESKHLKDERSRSIMMKPTSICVSQKSLITTPWRSTSPTQYDSDNGETARTRVNIGTKPVLCTTRPTHTKSSADMVEVSLIQPSEEDKALSISPEIQTSVLAGKRQINKQINFTSPLFIANVTLLTGLWPQMICVYTALGNKTRFIE